MSVTVLCRDKKDAVYISKIFGEEIGYHPTVWSSKAIYRVPSSKEYRNTYIVILTDVTAGSVFKKMRDLLKKDPTILSDSIETY